MSALRDFWDWWVGLNDMAGMRSLKGTLYLWTIYILGGVLALVALDSQEGGTNETMRTGISPLRRRSNGWWSDIGSLSLTVQ